MSIGDFLRRKRIEQALTQSQIAEKLEVSLATVFKWEHNVSKPPKHLRARIVAYLGFDPEKKPAEATAG